MLSPLPATGPHTPDARLRTQVSVLILDDERFDRHKLARFCDGLPMQCDLSHADSLAALGPLLDTAQFDLIFVDHILPDGSGLDALARVQNSRRNRNTACIMITGHEGEGLALAAMEKGCADYITKADLTPASFSRAVTNALQKSALSSQVAVQTFARSEVELVLKRFASQCANDIKPLVSRMMRQLRNMGDLTTADAAQRDSMEASCMHLWDFLDDLEKHHPDAVMRDLATRAAISSGASSTAFSLGVDRPLASKQRKKPPSPFSRTH